MILLFEIELARETQTLETHNALLRGEQRNTNAAAYHLNH